ncbi:NDP-sugar synthase [Candidatus Bathyarchaeota archaeon]|nr:NDP-sugar synthase [Candidatus Bathyarchaeota archaeon]
MKAIILAGGFGTRLRPLSCTRPKMLLPVANQPLIDWCLMNLSKSDVDTAILAVNYFAEALVRYLGTTKYDLGILYSREQRPMGTGGPLKKAKEMLNLNEPFIVMNGDIITDFDIKRLVDYHKEKKGLATLAIIEVPDPGRFGSVERDSESHITRFVEKPEPGKAPSNLINAGIYVLEPEVLNYIPNGGKVSIERQVFPILAKEGKLYGYEIHAQWIDVGVSEDYLRANALLLNRSDGVKAEKAKVNQTATLISPCNLAEGVEIGEDSIIGPNVAIAENVLVGKGCRIENSIIFPGATIGDYTNIKNAIIGENAILHRWVKIESGSLIGDYAEIEDGVTLTRGVTVCPSKTVGESVLDQHQVM